MWKGGTAVVDGKHYRVYVFSNNGVYRHTVMSTVNNHNPDGILDFPFGVGITSHGQMAITDNTANQNRAKYVKLYNVNGTYHSRFCTLAPHEPPNTLLGPCSITVSSSDGTIYVGDIVRKVVTIHSGSDGTWKEKVNLSVRPFHLATNSRHQIIASDWQVCKVVCVDYIGEVMFTLDTFSVDGKPGRPTGVTHDGDEDTLYVAVNELNANTGHIHQYSSNGKFMHCAMKGLYSPRGITWYNGSIYIANDISVLILGKS